ncbi:hypothetical protein GCM10027067_33450 [Pseudactinotalea suaedae]
MRLADAGAAEHQRAAAAPERACDVGDGALALAHRRLRRAAGDTHDPPPEVVSGRHPASSSPHPRAELKHHASTFQRWQRNLRSNYLDRSSTPARAVLTAVLECLQEHAEGLREISVPITDEVFMAPFLR